MSIQTALECWRDYIDPIGFENLTDFLIRTENGEKINKLLLLEGDGGTGKSTFINEIIANRFGYHSFNTNVKLVTNVDQYNGSPTPTLSQIINKNYSLCIINEPNQNSNFNNNLRLLAEDRDFVHRPLYKNQQIGKIKGNFVIVAQLGQLSPSLNDILVRVQFTHKFI
jgi:hypothetical protein